MSPGEVPARRAWRDVDGLLLLDKPVGLTSNAALQTVRRLYGARKAGHTGSLDPLASGMLPVCFGEATKFAGYLLDADKTYRVQARLGIRTATGDAEGEPVATREGVMVTPAGLVTAMAGLTGAIEQVPPMYSALKHQGERLYALARAGLEVPRAPRQVWIREFVLESFDPVTPVFRVRCSKGTYIRTLIEDLAERLGTLGHVILLRRLSVAPYEGEPMVTLADLKSLAEAPASGPPGGLLAHLRPLEAVLPHWPRLVLGEALAHRAAHGGDVPGPPGQAPGPVSLFGPGGRFLGIGDLGSDGQVKPRRMVAANTAAGPGTAGGL